MAKENIKMERKKKEDKERKKFKNGRRQKEDN